ncbi:anti-sigma factor [Mesobacterium pallidum]|uniref:anti-sigma factor n=1 Tax=Mesobacterium pallidum TaxID=2872037 RepID=UPI001EE29C84|nr:anti-sigma factor [Mesobacterium pallidum]
MSQPDDPDDIALAGEYVLHLMDAETRRAFEARILAEPALAALVLQWEASLVQLSDDFVPTPPPPRVWRQIEAELFPKARARTSPLRWLAGAAFGAALVAAVVLILPQTEFLREAPASHAAEVAAEDGSLVIAAAYSAETGTLRLDRVAGEARPGRVLELWLIAEGAPAPVSLGVLPDETEVAIAIPAALAEGLTQGGTLAVSDEPPGGSPTGVPTGDVLAVGPVQSL